MTGKFEMTGITWRTGMTRMTRTKGIEMTGITEMNFY